jgi:predicted N-acetyltransferase YhbS
MIELAQRPMRIVRERRRDGPAIETLIGAAFGPDRMQKTVYRLREDVRPIRELCFVALDDRKRLVASLRFWPILINERWPAVLLGPLAVSPDLRGLGYGKALMWHGLARCRELGISRVVLVGDPEYYNPFGFRRELALNLQLPGWVEERRFLALETIAGAMVGVHGMIGKAAPPPKTRPEPKKIPARKRDRARDQARKARARRRLEKRRTPARRKPARGR